MIFERRLNAVLRASVTKHAYLSHAALHFTFSLAKYALCYLEFAWLSSEVEVAYNFGYRSRAWLFALFFSST